MLRILSLALVSLFATSILPLNAYAAHDSDGKPTNLADKLVLAIYNGTDFPGEPTVNDKSDYTSFNSSFSVATSFLGSPTFKSRASDELDPEILNELQEGTHTSNTKVWGVFNTSGIESFLLSDSSILQPQNEAKIIRAVKGLSSKLSDEEVLSEYEILWYVIKYQAGSGFLSTDSWHMDGIIKEVSKRAVNYYGNGNTAGNAPEGTKTLTPNTKYQILPNSGNMTKVIDGIEVDFLGWNTKADGTGTTYQPGDTITVTEDLSLYAMWDTVDVYNATVTTYLNSENKSASQIYGEDTTLYLSSNGNTFIKLTENASGNYTANISHNGGYFVYKKTNAGYEKLSGDQLTIHNKDGHLDLHYYTVSYDENGGVYTGDAKPEQSIWPNGSKVIAESSVPALDGYKFVGWMNQNGEIILPGDLVTDGIGEETVLTAQWELDVYTITAVNTTGGTVSGAGQYVKDEIATLNATAQNGYIFTGWYENEILVTEEPSFTITVTENRDFVARFSKIYTVTALSETGGSVTGGGQYQPLTDATVTATANSDYYFIGWYGSDGTLITAEQSYTHTVIKDVTLTAKFEKKFSYNSNYIYILGYEDSEIGAEGPLLRCEVAQMIYRLVKQNGQLGSFRYSQANTPVFSDTEGEWFRSGIEYMHNKGAIRTGTKSYPLTKVTRGETYKMICLGLGFTTDADLAFSDYATILYNNGYIDAEGREKVTAKIVRWEFCDIFNRIIGRSYASLSTSSGLNISASTYGYTDLLETAHYYEIMLRATSCYSNGYVDLNNRIDRNDLDDYSD